MNDVRSDTAPLKPVPDLSDLPVSDAGGRPIGSVFGTLADVQGGLLRYVDIALVATGHDRARHVLVPIGHVRIEERNGGEPEVRLRVAVLDDLTAIPAFAPDQAPLDEEFERELLEAYGRIFYGDRYYAHPAYDHDGLYAGPHPIVRTEAEQPRPSSKPHLCLFSEASDLRLVDGEPDIVGWPLMTDADLPSARIRDLLVDPGSLEVRYIVADPIDEAGDLVLPIGFLQIADDEQAVYAPGLRHDDLADVRRFDAAHFERADEDTLRKDIDTHVFDRRRYQLPDYRDGRIVDRRSDSRSGPVG
jgi:hypothetical protein